MPLPARRTIGIARLCAFPALTLRTGAISSCVRICMPMAVPSSALVPRNSDYRVTEDLGRTGWRTSGDRRWTLGWPGPLIDRGEERRDVVSQQAGLLEGGE